MLQQSFKRNQLVPLAVGGGGAAGYVNDLEGAVLRVRLEEDAPVANAAAEGGLTVEPGDIANEGLPAHCLKRGEQSRAVVLRSAGDGLLRGLSKDELPGKRGVHQE